MNKVLELSSKSSKGGRRKIKMILLTIHNKDEKNLNGISWNEQYIVNNLDSIKGIPICTSFLDEEKITPLDHGYTDTVELEDGKLEPLFNNSECCGVIEDAKIEDLEINNETKRVLVGYGYLFYQRYKNFCDYIKEKIVFSEIKSSVEIVGKEGNNIIYDGGYNQDIRYPMEFDFSATAILGVKEADENCYVLEVAQNQKKEEENMDEKVLKDLIVSTISEINSKNDEFSSKINELNAALEMKDAEIKELKDSKESETNSIKEKDKRIEELNSKITDLEKELGECKKSEQNAALNNAVEGFSDDEKKFAESEINSFRENPLEGNVDAIVSKIYACIGQAKKMAEAETRTSEQNSAKETETIDIFAEINSVNADGKEDINIF